MMRYTFRFITNYKPPEWSLHEHIKRHFRVYDTPNLAEAHRQLAENLMSEFGLVDGYEVIQLQPPLFWYKMRIGNVLTVGYTVDACLCVDIQ